MFDRIIDVLLQFLDLFKFFEVIDQYQRALVLRFGKLNRELDPGLHFVIPFGVERVLSDNVVPTISNLGPQSLTTEDGKAIIVGSIVTWQVRDIQKLLLEVQGKEEVMIDSTYGIIGQHVTSSPWETVRTPEFLEKVTKEVRRQAFKYGIEVIRVQFTDLTQSRSLRLWGANAHQG